MNKENTYKDLLEFITKIDNIEDMESVFKDIFTDAERKDFTLRWQLLNDLYQHIPQREIAANLKISLCKITRGSKILKNPNSLVRKELSDRYDDHLHI